MAVPGGPPPSLSSWVAAAARNNAEWCDAVCRAHGLEPTFGEQLWRCPVRPPRFYPDAVTLSPEVTAATVVGAISPGGSVKDSFGCLELGAHGFELLFDAQWLLLRSGAVPTDAPSPSGWERLSEPESLRRWELAWSGGDAASGLFRPELLADPRVLFLGVKQGGTWVSGAVLNRSDGEPGVVGLTNVFGPGVHLARFWSELVHALPGFGVTGALVGYERGPALHAALEAGFETIGPLRVWVSSRP
jgi:hypothetical protein